MRIHKKYRAFDYPRDKNRVRDVVALRSLASARIEPVLSGGVHGGLLLDLTFARDGLRAAVPFVEISGEMLDRRESSPFIWPAWLAECIDFETGREIERALLPWIEAQTFNRTLNAEIIRVFGSQDERITFERAREFGFAGAAPYRVLMQMSGAYVYAERLARERHVHAVDSQGGSGAAILAKSAAAIRADLGSLEANALAREWFDLDIYGECGGVADVKIGGSGGAAFHIDLSGVVGERVALASPVPMDVLASFDPEDAPPVRHFSVTAPSRDLVMPAMPRWEEKGGSSGRILLLIRDGAARTPDADTDGAFLLAARLQAEGFTVDVREASAAAPEGYDLVHCCCAAYVEQALEPLKRAKAARVPVVITEPAQPRDGDASWGTVVMPQVLRVATDETILTDHLRLVQARKLEGDGAVPFQEPFAGYRNAAAELLALADAIVPANATPFLPQPRPPAPPPGTPHGPFALVHAPVWPQSNQFAAVRAAAIAGIPLVVAGPVADVEYLRQIRMHGGTGLVTLPEPSAGEVAGLYAAANIYVDVAWLRLGTSRIALAQAAGCSIVAAPSVDQADEQGIAAALERASKSPRPAPFAPGPDPLNAVVTAYSNCAAAGRNT